MPFRYVVGKDGEPIMPQVSYSKGTGGRRCEELTVNRAWLN
jgi:hypothetical protein